MRKSFVSLLAVALTSGCTINTRDHINTGVAAASAIPKTTAPQRVARAAGVQAQQEAQAAQARADLTAGLDRALRDTGKLPPLPGPAAADKQLPLLPRAIYREDALNKLLDVTKASVKDEVVSDVRFSPREIMSFAPTAATWDQTLAMEATAQTNVTLREARAIQVFSGMAADRSGAISSALVRSFGGAELSVVIGGKFSIGDNETLAKVVDTWVEATSRRLAEAVFYKQFLSPGEPDGIQDMLDLIEWVAKQS